MWTTPSGWEGGLDKVAVSGSVELAKGLRLVFWTESRLGLAFTGRGKHTATESNEDTDREVHMYVDRQTGLVQADCCTVYVYTMYVRTYVHRYVYVCEM